MILKYAGLISFASGKMCRQCNTNRDFQPLNSKRKNEETNEVGITVLE